MSRWIRLLSVTSSLFCLVPVRIFTASRAGFGAATRCALKVRLLIRPHEYEAETWAARRGGVLTEDITGAAYDPHRPVMDPLDAWPAPTRQRSHTWTMFAPRWPRMHPLRSPDAP